MTQTLEFSFVQSPEPQRTRQGSGGDLAEELRSFDKFGSATVEERTRYLSSDGEREVPTFVNEYWTSAQRDAHSLHEVSYRACFKPQLPRFFIERLTSCGDRVYDPFMGRGTTLLEAALLGRIPVGNDINPLSRTLIRPRLNPPSLSQIADRMSKIDFHAATETWDELLVFYHPETLLALTSLRNYFCKREQDGMLDAIDEWIRMVAVNRLTGHSPGFFSVYTLPPNQAVSIKSQLKINRDRNQVPPRRDVAQLILKKSRALLKDVTPSEERQLAAAAAGQILSTAPANQTPAIPDGSIELVVTSPPFLDVVQYATDNWLRCWFLGIEADDVELTVPSKLQEWETAMTGVFRELNRVLRSGGHVAFEVGEVRGGTIRLEETVLRCGTDAGLEPRLVLINAQEFTKTANCWGVTNNGKGTNTNRIVLFRKRG